MWTPGRVVTAAASDYWGSKERKKIKAANRELIMLYTVS